MASTFIICSGSRDNVVNGIIKEIYAFYEINALCEFYAIYEFYALYAIKEINAFNEFYALYEINAINAVGFC